MAITITHPVDELKLRELSDDGYTTFKLYYTDELDGNFADSSASIDQDIATALLGNPPYKFVFTFANGNPAYWYKVVAYDGVSAISPLNEVTPFHGGGGTTLKALRRKIGRFTDTMVEGTTTGASADGSSLTANSALFNRFADDYFGGVANTKGWIALRNSTDEWTNVSDFVSATGVISVSPSFGTTPGSGESFELHSRWTPETYRHAINWAISECYPSLFRNILDLSLYTEEDKFQYQLPNNIRQINRIEVEMDTDTTYTDQEFRGHPFKQMAFDVIDNGLVRYIEFKRDFLETGVTGNPGRRIRIHGTGFLNFLYNDSDYTEVVGPQADLLVYKATSRLYQMLASSDNASDVDRFVERSQYFENLYQQNAGRRNFRRRAQKMWGNDAKWSGV